ncbi:MAG: heparan-alpha-glucosaminide N-acetyltransferase domain-containing protein [Deltaproteobacteria bacterium]|nr:heparan-alpha-glucosaminide N-acetyltransferase domain-containing protein [Deltaproteobacteria bacterium]
MISHGDRILSIDVARGFALVCMALSHFTIFYSSAATADRFTIFFFEYLIAGWGAGAFLMMMGMSQVFSSGRGSEDKMPLLMKALLRGGYLFVVGLTMLFLAMGPDTLWRWEILTLMGFATLVIFFCRFLSSWSLVALSVVIAVSTPYLRRTIDIVGEWGGAFAQTPFISKYLPGMFVEPVSDYSSAWEFGKIIKGFFLAGDFPVLPWVMFPVIGLIMGRRIMQGKMRQDLPKFFTLGFILLCLGFGFAYLGSSKPADSVVGDLVSPFCFYPDSFSMISAQVGMSIIALSLFYFIFDVRKKKDKKPGPITRFFIRTSNFALTFYFLHYLLLGWPLMVIYFYTGRYPHLQGNYYNLMGVFPALLCGIGAVALLEIVIFFWERKGSKYGLEWLLRVLTERIVPGYQRRRT